MTELDPKQPIPGSGVPAKKTVLPAESRWPAWWLAVMLAVVTVGLYWPVTHCDFIHFDDQKYVIQNPQVQGGLTLKNTAWAFTASIVSNWHPLTWLSLMLDVDLFGNQPAGFHFTNLVLHTVNVVLLFWLLRRLTGSTWRSAIVAAVFGWHPLHVESVAWISERKDVLSTCFGFLSLLFYASYAQGFEESKVEGPKPKVSIDGERIYYGLSLLMFLLGLLSKPMLVTWPFVLLLLDYWPLGRLPPLQPFLGWWPLVREKIPFLILVPLASVVTFLAQQHGGAVATMEHLTLGMRFENALVSYCAYLGKLFWPVHLAFFYPHPGRQPAIKLLLAAVLLVSVSCFLVKARRRLPFLLMGWLWFLGTLVPVIGLVQVGEQAMADRYMYIPSVGILIMIVWGAHALTNNWDRWHLMERGSVTRSTSPAKPSLESDSASPSRQGAAAHRPALPEKGVVAAFSVVASAALLLCLILTRQQIGYWQNSETLFRHALAVTENNYLAHVNLGAALVEGGHDDAAISEYQTALRLHPNDAGYRNDLGIVLFRQGRTEESLSQFQEAIRLNPENAYYHANLGNLLAQLGQTNEAASQWQASVRLSPDFVQARQNLALASPDRTNAAIIQDNQKRSQYHTIFGVEDRTNAGRLHDNLGDSLARKGENAAAIIQFQEAVRLNPNNAKARDNLGIVLLKQGRTNEAVGQFQEAVRLQPDFAKAHDNLGFLLARQGRMEEAIHEWREVLRLQPGHPEAQSNLTRVLQLKSGPEGGSTPP